MAFESLQGVFSTVILLCAGIAALLGLIFVNKLFKKKSQQLDGIVLFTFSFLTLGYIALALGELTRFLLFSVFKQPPAISMPDLYWVVGGLSLLIAYVVFSVHLHRKYAESGKAVALAIISVAVLAVLLFYFSSVDFFSGTGTGEKFLGYYYPIISSLVLVASLSVYLYIGKVSTFKEGLLFFIPANIATLIGDMLYNYYNYMDYATQGIYGLVGMGADVLYVIGYALFAIGFLALFLKLKEIHES
ncbi:MAG: hypothetical protein AABY26_06100 [Nanoarchaeota archaeon]